MKKWGAAEWFRVKISTGVRSPDVATRYRSRLLSAIHRLSPEWREVGARLSGATYGTSVADPLEVLTLILPRRVSTCGLVPSLPRGPREATGCRDGAASSRHAENFSSPVPRRFYSRA